MLASDVLPRRHLLGHLGEGFRYMVPPVIETMFANMQPTSVCLYGVLLIGESSPVHRRNVIG